jgi:phage tail-like protein
MARPCTSDPLEKFRFQVDFLVPGATSMVRVGFHDVQMPKRSTNKVTYREGAQPDISTVSAGLSTMEDVVMSRGVIAADGTQVSDFLGWIKKIHTGTATDRAVGDSIAPTGAQAYRSEVSIKMLDRSGVIVRCWTLYQAWPMHYVPGSDLNAGEDGEKSMEALTIAYEDFKEFKVVSGAVSTDAL